MIKTIKGRIGKLKHLKVNDIYAFKKLLISYFKKFNKMPGLAWLRNKTNFDKNKIYELTRQLRKEKFLLIKNEKLIINPDIALDKPRRKVFPQFKKINDKNFITPFSLEKLKKNAHQLFSFKEINKKKLNTNNWIIVLRYILLTIGVGATYMSIYYSDNWLREFLNPFRALLLATIMVTFAVSAFELIILFFQRKRYFLIFVFSFLWAIVTIFSMVSTVAGQYNARIEKLNTQYKQEKLVTDNDRKYKEYTEQKEEYLDRKKILTNDIKQLQNILGQYVTKEMIEENKKQYTNFRWRFYQSKKELNQISKKLKNLRKNTNIKIVKKNSPDFYLWMSRIFRWRADMIQFWLSVFPAMFIDLIAPISFAIVMFVRKGV